MFTGLIQKTGEVVAVESSGGAGRIVVRASPWPEALQQGESIAVNGVCLTLTKQERETLWFDVLRETFEKTNLGGKKAGSLVNLERSLKVGDAIGGHFVTGHVDGVGQVRSIDHADRDWRLEVKCSQPLLLDMVVKGSIACDGISLTVVDLDSDAFSVHIIPHTWENTTLGQVRKGDAVNLENDLLGKHVRRIIERGQSSGSVTWDTLRRSGFVA